MAVKTYVMKTDYRAPYVTVTGLPHNPSAIKLKLFRKGEMIRGDMKHANNKPAFLLVNGVCVVPLDVVKEVVTKEVVSNADGTGGLTDATTTKPKTKTVSVATNSKVRYLDAGIIGALVGVLGVYVCEKQGYIKEPDSKYKIYGAAAGAALACYLVYRAKNAKPRNKVVQVKED